MVETPNPTYEVAENHDQSIRDHGHQSLISLFERRSGYSLKSTMNFSVPRAKKIYFRRSNHPPRLRKRLEGQNSISSCHPFQGLVDGFDQTEMLKLASSRGTQVHTVFSRFFCVCACLCWGMGMGKNEVSNIGTLPFRYDSTPSMVENCSRKEGRKGSLCSPL